MNTRDSAMLQMMLLFFSFWQQFSIRSTLEIYKRLDTTQILFISYAVESFFFQAICPEKNTHYLLIFAFVVVVFAIHIDLIHFVQSRFIISPHFPLWCSVLLCSSLSFLSLTHTLSFSLFLLFLPIYIHPFRWYFYPSRSCIKQLWWFIFQPMYVCYHLFS